MTESLLERSARYIDGCVYEGPRSINPIDGSFHEVADDLSIVCGFSHIWTLDTAEGLVDPEVHALRAEVYRVRREHELSLMARGLYLDASRSSEAVANPE